MIQVEADTSDQLLLKTALNYSEDIVYVWIDVQGYEGYVFKGAEKIFDKSTSVVSEIWPYGIHRVGMSKDEFCDIVKRRWTDFWVFKNGRFIHHKIDDFFSFCEDLELNGYFECCLCGLKV